MQLSVDTPPQSMAGEQTAASRPHTNSVSRNMTDSGPEISIQSRATRVTDAVSEAIEAFAVAERIRNFYFLARNSHHRVKEEDLFVYRAAPEEIKTSTSRWDVDLARPSSWYTFFQPRWGITDTVPLRCPLDAHQATLGHVLDIKLDLVESLDVEETKCWMPVCDWMRKKFEWHDDRDWMQRGGRQLQLENQITWWKLNGKHFNFIQLPAELRDMIYTMSLGPDTDNPNKELLMLSRQIRKEATWIRASSTRSLCLSSPCTKFNDGTIHSLDRLSSLKRLRLQLSAACYFELIGIHPQCGAPLVQSGKQSKHDIPLNRLPVLEQLDLLFLDPTHPDAQCPLGGICTGQSCQKIWIDWFFTLALEYLLGKNICVTMGGCIPDSVRAKWEHILKEALLDTSGVRQLLERQFARP